MTNTKPDFKAALASVQSSLLPWESADSKDWPKDRHPDDFITVGELQTIRTALLIADKLMQEPSESMIRAGISAFNAEPAGNDETPEVTAEWCAMRDQLLKEIL